MQLYEKVITGKRTTYRPYVQPAARAEMELDNGQVATLAGTIGMCTLISLERHLPEHAMLSRRIKAIETAIVECAKLGGKTIDRRMTDAGVVAWGAAVQKLAEVLSA